MVSDGSVVASAADRASYRPKSFASQRDSPSPSRHQSVSSLGSRAFHPTFKEIARTYVHSNHHFPRHRSNERQQPERSMPTANCSRPRYSSSTPRTPPTVPWLPFAHRLLPTGGRSRCRSPRLAFGSFRRTRWASSPARCRRKRSGAPARSLPGGAIPCALRAYVAFYVTFEPTLRYSSRKQQFKLFLLGELSHSCLEWQSEAGGGKTLCLSAFLEVGGWGSSTTISELMSRS